MSLWRLVARSLWFYRRTHGAVVLAVVVATAVLTGALAVGDSVKHTLRKTLEARLGATEFAVVPQNRFFRSKLAEDLAEQLGGQVAPALQVAGIVTNADGMRRVNRVDVLGVDPRFYVTGLMENPFAERAGAGAVLNESVARRLAVTPGDEIVLRVEKPGLMPRDVPLASDADRTVAFRLKVLAVAGASAFGRFSLQANQVGPLTVFVPLQWLAERIGQPGRANMLLASRLKQGITADEVNVAMEEVWTPADVGLEVRSLQAQNLLELRSRRIFIDDVLATEALKVDPNALGIMTYFVNEIRHGDRATPYSMVAAMGRGADAGQLMPPNMGNADIVINQWLADDLGAKIGDTLEIAYYLVGPKRKLYEERRVFKVVKIVPVEGPARDPGLMPDFPGLADADNCRDWEPGMPVDLDKIRPKDEAYWDDHRGMPKAFITLESGQAKWRNRYGSLTAVRYPQREGLDQEVGRHLRRQVDPATVGLFVQPVRQRGEQAGQGGTDFGQLFLGLSMFLIASAIILTGLLFVFGVESRADQIGMLLAVGLPAKRVKRLLRAESGVVALLGVVVGMGAGLLYTRLMIHGLSTLWSGAVAGSEIYFHAKPLTLLVGGLSSLGAVLFALWITLRRHLSRSARELLAGSWEPSGSTRKSLIRGRLGLIIAIFASVGAVVLLLLSGGGDSQTVAGVFFGAGALLLLGGLGLSHALLQGAGGGWTRPMVSLGGLGLRNATRRRGRSLAIIGLLACGVFMVIAVGANRHNPSAEPQGRTSGTGGFALYGEASVGVLHDLNTTSGRKALGFDANDLDGVEVVQFRVHDGDDASCLNLNRAQQPRLLGVAPQDLTSRAAFKFTATIGGGQDERGWSLLRTDLEPGVVPAIGDYPTVFWGLGKNIGDELEYSDEMGRTFRVRIVGMVGSSILQGSLLIAENEFTARFPSEDGYRVFLVDAAEGRADAAQQVLSSGLRDFGVVLTPAPERMAAFSAVENTYLSIFTALGGLGLVLGSVGLGLVVLRNMLERRGELAMLRAIGFDRGRLKRMVLYEHGGLLLAGLFCGVVAAGVAVIPAVQSPGGEVPLASLAVTVLLIGFSGGLWVWMAGTLALRGGLWNALRNE